MTKPIVLWMLYDEVLERIREMHDYHHLRIESVRLWHRLQVFSSQSCIFQSVLRPIIKQKGLKVSLHYIIFFNWYRIFLNIDTSAKHRLSSFWFSRILSSRGYLYSGNEAIGQSKAGTSILCIYLLWVVDKEPKVLPWNAPDDKRNCICKLFYFFFFFFSPFF